MLELHAERLEQGFLLSDFMADFQVLDGRLKPSISPTKALPSSPGIGTIY